VSHAPQGNSLPCHSRAARSHQQLGPDVLTVQGLPHALPAAWPLNTPGVTATL
jgi:hypothetical protein